MGHYEIKNLSPEAGNYLLLLCHKLPKIFNGMSMTELNHLGEIRFKTVWIDDLDFSQSSVAKASEE